ncbi:unnamed protein product [Debaryomyces tyrocola]|nr:unnamed protein product [Debaryomyces tyrocola]
MFSVENSLNSGTGGRSGGDLGYNGFPVSLNYFTALPDPTILHNPNVTIIFKSLLKKDSITKEKSLNDFIQVLDDYDNESVVVDDLLILSWIQLYAKLAIDNSRSVRILSHQTQSKLLGIVGGKAFSKYLVSSIPIWLQGLYDNDKLVSSSTYKTLLHSFQDNKERVDSKIWVTFYEPIINYIVTVVNLENHKSLSDQRYTKETDSFAKYERVLNGSVMMLNKVINLINDGEIKVNKGDKELEQIEELLNLDILWDYLGTSISADTLNLPLFKSLLILIRYIFGNVPKDGSDEPNVIIKNLNNPKALYKLVSRKFIKHVKLKPSKKGSNNDIIYSNIILQFWDSMISLTGFSLLSPQQRKALKIKKNFWELGGNKSRSRLLDYLKLGSCLLNPIYYVVIGQFFQTLSKVSDIDNSVEFIHLNSLDDAKLIINDILCSQLKTLTSFEYKERCFSCILRVYEIFKQNVSETDSNQVLGILRLVLYQVLDIGGHRAARNETVNKLQGLFTFFGDFLNKNFSVDSIDLLLRGINSEVLVLVTSEDHQELLLDNFEFKSPTVDVITNYFNLLIYLAKFNDSANNLIDVLIEDICKSVEEETIMSEPNIAFHIIVLFIKSYRDKPDRIGSNVKGLITSIPSFIEPQFVETPIKMLSAFLNSGCNTKDGIDLKELISDYFIKTSATDESKIPLLLSAVSQPKDFDQFNVKADFPDIYQYLLELSRKDNLSEKEAAIVFGYTNDQVIFKNLINASNTNDEQGLKFIDYFLKYSATDNLNQENEKLDFYGNLFLICWKNIDKPIHQDFLTAFAKKISPTLFIETVYQFTSQSSVETDFSSAAKYLLNLSESPKNVFELLPLEKYFKVVADAVEYINIDLLAIANPLEQNIFLGKGNSKDDFHLDLSLITIGKFLVEFSNYLDSTESNEMAIDILVTSGIIAEYIHDYFFLQNDDNRLIVLDDQILSIRADLLKTFKNNIKSISLSSLVPIINDDQSKNNDDDSCLATFNRLNKEISKGSGLTNFLIYSARLMKIYLDKLVELETSQSFEADIVINFNRLLSSPLKLSVVLLSFSKFFFKSNKFDRIRNYLAAEILGVKSDTQILDDGLKWLTLVINFFNADLNELKRYEVIPSHRLALILNQLSKWLESDISYNESFITVRCQITRFLNGLLHGNNENLPDRFWGLAIHLCLDNLGIAQTEPKHLELQYFTLKLFISLNKVQKYDNDNWFENKDSLHEEILDLIANHSNHLLDLNFNNQPVYLCHELLKRICKDYEFSSGLLNDKLADLYALLYNSRFIGLQRIGASLLHEVILTNQQDFVVEYQLQKSNLGSSDNLEDGSDQFKAEIPRGLIESIQLIDDVFSDSIEFETSYKVSRALWSWYLIFDHFKDITYSIRSEYISQLKAGGYIDKLLSLIFELVDVANTNGILKKLHTSEDTNSKIKPNDNLVQSYNLSQGIVGETFKFEMKFLLLHLYYLSFQYLGSYVQAWFNGIRDRQLKQKIEKFSIKYVSPLIVHKILEDVSKSKDKLTNKDENMSIKVSTAANEIKSVYLIDEQTMEMVIKIPDSYPLSNVSVEGPLRIGVKENQWKAWLLASQRIISLTNGSIIESIELFNRNVNLHFSGFEDCAICYSILHQDHSLPSKTCPTCLNKFHAACLYKWFKSSGASTCPLCRSAFNFRTPKSVGLNA